MAPPSSLPNCQQGGRVTCHSRQPIVSVPPTAALWALAVGLTALRGARGKSQQLRAGGCGGPRLAHVFPCALLDDTRIPRALRASTRLTRLRSFFIVVQVEMRKELLLYPRHFGPNVQEILLEKLISSVEGSCSGRYGFVVCVTDVFETGKGKIREGAPLSRRVWASQWARGGRPAARVARAGDARRPRGRAPRSCCVLTRRLRAFASSTCVCGRWRPRHLPDAV